jgi:hypothetical protein
MSVERSAKRRIAVQCPAQRDVVLCVFEREGVLTSPLDGDRFRPLGGRARVRFEQSII